jgi:eukaryotic-like serine/threonine-protein kinase
LTVSGADEAANGQFAICMLSAVRWKVNDNLGSGKFGVVFSCREEDSAGDSWPYALKRLQSDWLENEEARARFKRETDIQGSLRHENIIRVVEAGESAKWGPWFVMPRAMNGSLKDAIADERAAEPSWSLKVFEGVLAGVAHAHEHQILHRDIKPSNILLFGDAPRIADFGIARQIDVEGTTLTHTAEQLGTFRYMAPEQFHDIKRAGAPADVYALGKVLCHLLSGILPEALKVDLHGVPSEYRHFIDKCCRDDPSQRFPTAAETLKRFQRLSTPVTVVLPPLEQGREIAEQAEASLGTETQQTDIEALETHFVRHESEHAVYMQVLPRISRGLVEAWLTQHLDGFRQVIAHYDVLLEESNLVFGYCDVVAKFYRDIFQITDDIGLKRLVLSRLVVMGHAYNRFFVHDVVVGLLPKLDDPCDVEIAEEVLEEHGQAAAWYAGSALKTRLPEPIAAALRLARPDL